MSGSKPVFLLGAGFNCDAASELRLKEAISIDGSRLTADYPLVAGLLECFDLTELPAGKSIENLFQEAIETGNQEPFKKLFHKLRYCDYKIPRKLVGPQAVKPNAYASFFEYFPGSDFVTFNYDGLVEIALLALKRWNPSDGYGVPVAISLPPTAETRVEKSSSRVVHVHGSLYIRWDEFTRPPIEPGKMAMIDPLRKPRYWFDPNAATDAFFPFERETITGDDDHSNRIIAPVPNKAALPVQPYVEEAYGKAIMLTTQANPLVAIGYSFNQYDVDSYARILEACQQGSRLVIVDPCARQAARRVTSVSPQLDVAPYECGFADWVRAGYPGVRN